MGLQSCFNAVVDCVSRGRDSDRRSITGKIYVQNGGLVKTVAMSKMLVCKDNGYVPNAGLVKMVAMSKTLVM